MEPRHRKQSYFGYAFESYGTAATPRRPSPKPVSKDPPGWGGNVDTNVQWCSVVRTKLGNNRLIIGGEVDCVRGFGVSQFRMLQFIVMPQTDILEQPTRS